MIIIFSKRGIGFHTRAKLLDLNFFMKKLSARWSNRQNCSHSVCQVLGPETAAGVPYVQTESRGLLCRSQSLPGQYQGKSIFLGWGRGGGRVVLDKV